MMMLKGCPGECLGRKILVPLLAPGMRSRWIRSGVRVNLTPFGAMNACRQAGSSVPQVVVGSSEVARGRGSGTGTDRCCGATMGDKRSLQTGVRLRGRTFEP